MTPHGSERRAPQRSSLPSENILTKHKLSRRVLLEYNGLVAICVAVPSWLIARDANAAAPKKNAAWEARAKELEGKEPAYTAAEPGKWKGKEGSHVPTASFDAGQVTVSTKHPMTAEHYITTHYIKNQKGSVIGLKEFTGSDPEARSTFPLPKGTTSLTVYSHCNLHDLWTTPSQKV
jgi:desulfoferrodoxin (superoxide reductase-like protein)